jgi:hypothetical protein
MEKKSKKLWTRLISSHLLSFNSSPYICVYFCFCIFESNLLFQMFSIQKKEKLINNSQTIIVQRKNIFLLEKTLFIIEFHTNHSFEFKIEEGFWQ